MDSDELKRIKKKRGVVRTATTKLTQKIDAELEKDELSFERLEELLDQVRDKEMILRECDKDIEAETEEGELEAEMESVMMYMDAISVRKTRLKRALRTEDEDRRSRHSEHEPEAAPRPRGNTVKLPKLVIQKFSGEICEWQGFWSQYKTTIHDQEHLSKTDKFSYLKSFLSGTAASAVAGLALSDDNYDTAIELLRKRFGRKDLVINAHMNKLLNMTPVKRATDVSALCKLYDDCEIQVCSLDALGVVADTYGSLLCPILLKMIPEEITLEFTKSEADNVLKAKELMNFMKLEVESRERTANLTQKKDISHNEWRSASIDKERTPERRTRRPTSGNMASAAAFHTSSQNDNDCLFCGKPDHRSPDCTESTVDIRREKLRRLGRCFVCLGPRHIACNCRAHGIECAQCGRRHHRAICNQQSLQTLQTTNKPDVDTAQAQCSVAPSESNGKAVLLQTATVWIDAPRQSQIAKCLLDGESQRSFIREDISKALNLPVVGTEIIKLHVFGSVNAKRMTARKVKATLRNLKPNVCVDVELLETPSVCSSPIRMASENIRRSLEAEGFQVADHPVRGMEQEALGLLIGGDYYWNIVTGNTKRLDNRLVAVESKFGWLIQGTVSIPVMCVTSCAVSGKPSRWASQTSNRIQKQKRCGSSSRQ